MKMNDISRQYLLRKNEIDAAVQEVFESARFINGPQVKIFTDKLSKYLDVPHVIPCGNGTDALRMALQALGICEGCEVILPGFTYIAPVEAVVSVDARPVLVDVDPATFNINASLIENAITPRTEAIIAVHLFGQSCDMEVIKDIAEKYNLKIIEDNAQSLGADYIFKDGRRRKLGTIGNVGITSFFPTKPLACYGDGGAMFTRNSGTANHFYKLANHGQNEKYHHEIIGCNSRLDTVQAAILNVNFKYIEVDADRRRRIAAGYDQALGSCPDIILPAVMPYSTHVYHQYTIRVLNGRRNALKQYLEEQDIPSMIYYPLPVHEQEIYSYLVRISGSVTESKNLTQEVLSLPIHPELTESEHARIIEAIGKFFLG